MRSKTGRGFVIYDEFTDTYGNDVRVQESSLAEDARLWIFADETVSPYFNPEHPAFTAGKVGIHLNVDQAIRIHTAIHEWLVDIGYIKPLQSGQFS